MALVTVGVGGLQTINQSETDSVLFLGTGTLNIAGTAAAPITVTLSQVAGAGVLNTINLSYATVRLLGAAGVSALTNYNIGDGGTLDLASSIGISAGSQIDFTGQTGRLVVEPGIDLSLLSTFGGFGPGKSIDFGGLQVASVSYADDPGTNTGGVITLLSAANAPLGTIRLVDGELRTPNFDLRSDGGTGTLLSFASAVTGITATPANSTLALGGTATLAVTMSNPVAITGTPQLLLNDGGRATFDTAASTPSQLVFRYTVGAGQNTADLQVTGIDLTGATAATVGGGYVNLGSFAVNPAGTLAVDTVAPTVTALGLSIPNGALHAGNSVNVQVTTSEPVLITGTPTLSLNSGGTAIFNATASLGNTLVFTYTVQPNQNTADLAVTGVNLNGAVATDAAGNPLDLSGLSGNPTGTLTIDTVAPVATSLVTNIGTGDLRAGQSVAFTATLSEPVVLSGAPLLQLNDGGTAVLDPVASSATQLVFRTTVAAGQNSADLAVTGVTTTGVTATDAAGNAFDWSSLVVNPAGTLVVDTTAPTAALAATTPATGPVGPGQTISITLALSEPVLITGALPTLTLSNGGTATLDPTASGATSLVFRYTVAPGQTATTLSVTGGSLNGATATDGAGNPLDLSTLAGTPIGAVSVDTAAPVATAVTLSQPDGALHAGNTVSIAVDTSEAVLLGGTGTPLLTLNSGGTATFDAAASSATHLVFDYTVQPGQNTADLAVTSMSLNGATATDTAGNPLDLSSVVRNPPGILAVDTIAPTIAGVAATPGSGNVGPGQTVSIAVTVSEAVAVAGGVPTLSLNDGGTATFDAAASSGNTLVFTYTVQPNQNTAGLAVTGANLNGAVIADTAGNPLDVSGLNGRPVGTISVDSTAPVLSSLVTDPGSGSLGAGRSVTLTATLSEPVTLSGGPPSLQLNDGGVATFDPASSTATQLVFRTTVLAGQNAADLAVTAVNTNGATATDASGLALDWSSLAVNPAGTLQIDTTAPTVTGVSTNPASGQVGTGSTVRFTVAVSEDVRVSGTAPLLLLNDGGTATFNAAASTGAALAFDYTVQAGQSSADLAITGVTAGGTSIADAADNQLDLSGAVGNPPGTLVVDTSPTGPTGPGTGPTTGTGPGTNTPPVVVTVETTPGSGALEAGDTVQVVVTTDHAVTVAGGTPTLSLSDGGTATFDPTTSGPTTLTFTHVVQPGQTAADLTVTGYDLKGATIQDANGLPLSLVAAEVNPPGVLTVGNQAGGGTGVGVPIGSDGESGSDSTIPIYRFFDSHNGTHFYTPSPEERASILANRPDLIPEGPDGVGLRAVDPASEDPHAVEVFRFFDKVHGTQFLTASATERDNVIATRSDLVYEPEGSFFEHMQPQPNDIPVYRFFSATDGTHFYTDSQSEVASVLQTRPDLIAEGIGFYEPR